MLPHKANTVTQDRSAPLPSGAPLSEGTVCLLFTMCVRGWWGMRDSWRVTGRQPAHPLVSVTWSPMPDWPWGERTPPPGSQEKCSYKLKKHEEAYDGLRTLLWLKKKKKKKGSEILSRLRDSLWSHWSLYFINVLNYKLFCNRRHAGISEGGENEQVCFMFWLQG